MRSSVWILLVPFVLMSGHASGQVTVSSFELGGYRFGSYPRDTITSTVAEPTFDRERFHPEVSIHGGLDEEETALSGCERAEVDR